jgi:hypothetical protein
MRLLGPLLAGGAVLFWLLMNGLLLKREIEYRGLDQYRRGVVDFLGEQVRRERWMGIFRQRKRIGHTGFAIERRLEPGVVGYRIWFSTRIDVDLFGQGGFIALEGSALLDAEMAPESLSAEGTLAAVDFRLEGRREAEAFLLRALDGSGRVLLERPFPLRDLHFGDGLAPVPPMARAAVGQSFRLQVFDPLFRELSESETRVVGEGSREVDGLLVDCLELETRYRGMTFRSFVTPDGEVLRQELPPPLDLVLIREPAPPAGRRR